MDQKTVYCVWCKGKDDQSVADKLRDAYGYEVMLPQRHKVFFKQGSKRIVDAKLTPGYLFVYTDTPIGKERLNYLKEFDCILEYADGSSELVGADYEYAMWIYRHHGVIEISQGVFDSQTRHVRFVGGPIMELGAVSRVDKNRQRVYVDIPFMGETRDLCLSFEFVAA